jgi:hypothetical protein
LIRTQCVHLHLMLRGGGRGIGPAPYRLPPQQRARRVWVHRTSVLACTVRCCASGLAPYVAGRWRREPGQIGRNAGALSSDAGQPYEAAPVCYERVATILDLHDDLLAIWERSNRSREQLRTATGIVSSRRA